MLCGGRSQTVTTVGVVLKEVKTLRQELASLTTRVTPTADFAWLVSSDYAVGGRGQAMVVF
jgi:hypothetical protein